MKRTAILAIIICLATATFAGRYEEGSLQNRTENWLQRVESAGNNSGELRGSAPTTGGQDPTSDPSNPAPLSDGLTIMLALSAGYGFFYKQKRVNNHIFYSQLIFK